MAKRNAEKKEIVLGLNSFNQPAELSGKDAWVKLIMNLLFMHKGTCPSDPNMGGELDMYDFAFIDNVKQAIKNVCMDQVNTYLPDIPLTGCDVSSYTLTTGQSVLLITLIFQYNEDAFDNVVVAAEKSNNQINFAIAM